MRSLAKCLGGSEGSIQKAGEETKTDERRADCCWVNTLPPSPWPSPACRVQQEHPQKSRQSFIQLLSGLAQPEPRGHLHHVHHVHQSLILQGWASSSPEVTFVALLENFSQLVRAAPHLQPHAKHLGCLRRAGPAAQMFSRIVCSCLSSPGGGWAGGTLLGAFNSVPLSLLQQMMAAAAAHPRGSAAVRSDLDFLQLLSGPSKPTLKKPDRPYLQNVGWKPVWRRWQHCLNDFKQTDAARICLTPSSPEGES